jgi:magnesium-transporting ATPase (P-type)
VAHRDLDDDFATIVGREGRQVFHNLYRSMQYLLMMHLPLVATAALLPLAGRRLLYLPIPIVWLEVVMHPTAAGCPADSARRAVRVATLPARRNRHAALATGLGSPAGTGRADVRVATFGFTPRKGDRS